MFERSEFINFSRFNCFLLAWDPTGRRLLRAFLATEKRRGLDIVFFFCYILFNETKEEFVWKRKDV